MKTLENFYQKKFKGNFKITIALVFGVVLSFLLSSCEEKTDVTGCDATYSNPVINFDHVDDEGRVYIPVSNWSDYPDQLFEAAPDLPACGQNTNSSRTWVDIYDALTDTRIYGFCALSQNEDLQDIWVLPGEDVDSVYIIINDRKCGKTYQSNTISFDGCSDLATPVIEFDHKDAEGRVYIPVTNWEDYPDEIFAAAPDLPACGQNANSSRTWVDIYDALTDTRIYGFCALSQNEDLQDIWVLPGEDVDSIYIIINDRKCGKTYQSNTISFNGCSDLATPVIEFDHKDAEGRVYIPVTNWEDYPDEIFAAAPDLPACGQNANSSRTWVDIYDAYTDTKIYGFCALGDNEELQDIWVLPGEDVDSVYIIINDRRCGKTYQSNTVPFYSCSDLATPEITFDNIDVDGRVYIPVTNWEDYPDEIFEAAPDLPACGQNTNSSRTWVDIYDADTDTRIYGFCALGDNEDLQGIWFSPGNTEGNVYIIINDRRCEKTYKSNTIAYGECVNTHPNPVIEYDHTDGDGRVYIPVTNWADYPNRMFREAPELPACGLNTSASRTWVDIYNADTDARIYGFCALGQNSNLQGIWFMPPAGNPPVYIIMHDRTCDTDYKSNTISY